MISPLKRMATTAIKKLTDLSGDGKTTQKDLLIARGVLNPDGTKVKSPNKQSVRSKTRQKELEERNNPNKEKSAFDKYLERNRQAAVERDLRQGFDTKATRALKESRDKALEYSKRMTVK